MSTRRGISIPFRLVDGSVAVAVGNAKTREDVVHVLLTAVGERVMRRDCGGGLEQLLYEPTDEVIHALLRRQVTVAMARLLPEIALIDVRVVDGNDGELQLDVVYLGPESVDPQGLSVPLYALVR
jgi:phage baseplate assembly protein W